MKVIFSILITVSLICMSAGSVCAFEVQNNPDRYIEGKNAAEDGNYREAAVHWISYADSLSIPEYRVGHKLIRLVTNHRLTEFYERTSEIYLRGLEDPDINHEEMELLLNDLYYIKSMLGRREENAVRDQIEAQNPDIFRFFSNFWKNKSLTPSDPYNERLMEHWERVNFALKNYSTVARAPYDDRGDIYIRFGEPQRKRDGIFMYNPGFANYLVATRMDDGRGYGSAVENAVNTTTYLNTLYRVVDYHQYPAFEVWVYYGLSNTPDNSVFLFGNMYGGAQMTLKQSVDDFIPSAAYSSTRRNNAVSMNIIQEETGAATVSSTDGDDDTETDVLFESAESGTGVSEQITPALILQMMYYRQLASLDPFFSGRYEEMLNRYENTSMRLSRSMARQFQQTNAAQTLITKRGMPEERSSTGNVIYELDTQIHAYRFADEDLNPVLRLFTEEDLDEVITFEELKKRNRMDDIRYGDYRLVRTIRLKTDSGDTVFEDRVTSRIDTAGTVAESDETAQIPYRNGSSSLEMITELYDDSVGDSNQIMENSTVRKNLKGVGRSDIPVEEYTARDGFFISDIIIGHVTGEDERFSIAHDRIIPEDSILRIYYEAYNLPRDESGLYTYELTYRLKRDRSLMGRIIRFGGGSESSMSVENTTDTPRFDQYLEIVSDQLKKGSYTLDLSFSDPASGEDLYTVTLPVEVE